MLVSVEYTISVAINLFINPSLEKCFNAKNFFFSLDTFYTSITAIIPVLVFSPFSYSLS